MLVTAPVLEPLTLEQAKLRAGLDWAAGDPRDVLMTGFIQTARNQVERETGVALLEQTHAVPIRAGCRTFELPFRPVTSVVVEAVDPTTGVVTAWSASPYVIDPSSVDPTPARITLPSGGVWPSGLRATLVVGFETVEELQASAPGLVHAVGLLTAHYATLGRDLAVVDAGGLLAIPMGYEDAIAPYRLVTLA
ncbi:MAG: hypothetical protein ABJA98_01710 [Acidobacteriota bacterium]